MAKATTCHNHAGKTRIRMETIEHRKWQWLTDDQVLLWLIFSLHPTTQFQLDRQLIACSMQLHLVKGIQHRTFDALTVFHRRTFTSGPTWWLGKPFSRWFKVIQGDSGIFKAIQGDCLISIDFVKFLRSENQHGTSSTAFYGLKRPNTAWFCLEPDRSWSKELHTGTNTCRHPGHL